MIFILIAVDPGRGNFSGRSGIEDRERNRAASDDLSAERNFEDGLLSKAYADVANMGGRKSDAAGSSGIINES
jgi:hypothetical protein